MEHEANEGKKITMQRNGVKLRAWREAGGTLGADRMVKPGQDRWVWGADGVYRADGSAGVGYVLRNAIKVMYEAVAHMAAQTSLGSLRTKGSILLVSEMNLSSANLETVSV